MTTIMKKITKGIVLNGESSDLSDNLEGSLFHNKSTARIKSYIQGAVREVLTNSQSQVLTNKTIAAVDNTIVVASSNPNLSSTGLNAALSELQDDLDRITNVSWTGNYDNGRTYTVGEGVMFNGASFRMVSFIGAGGYAPPSYPGSWLQVTDYVPAISSATQSALDGKANSAHTHVAADITDFNSAVDARIADVALDSDDIDEGTTNLYFTNERVDDRVKDLLVAGSGVSLTYDDIANTLTINAAGSEASVIDSIADADTTNAPSRNAVFDALALKANSQSPDFTGTPTAPTAITGDNSTKIATTAFVTTAVAAGGGGGSTIRSYTQAEQLSVNKPVYLESSTSVGIASASSSRKNCIGVVKAIYSNTTTYSFSENFESGSFTTNGWNVVNGTQANQFRVGTAVSNSGAYSAYISNDNGVSNTYSNTTSTVWFWKDIAISSDEYLNFKYKVNGEFSSFPYDAGQIIIDPNRTVIPVAGTSIISTPSGGINTDLPTSNNLWINKQLDLSSYAGTTVRVIFGWKNDSLTNINPAIAIDDITIGILGTCDVQVDGTLSGFSGLIPGSIYYLPSSTSLSLTTSLPSGTSFYGVPVGIAISSTELDIIPVASSYSDLSNKKIATIKDVKAAGTSGGTAVTGVWTARVLNTLSDPKSIVTSLTSNVFTLPAGAYYINTISPLAASANAAARGRIKLRNTTDAVDTILGMSGRTSFGTSDGNLFVANLNGVFSISTSKQFEIQYFVNVAGADSLGAATTDGLDAIYTTVILEKIG